MIINRPYNSKNNDINTTQNEIIINWAKKHNEETAEINIYEHSVIAIMESGRKVRMSMTDGCMSRYNNVRNHLLMYEEINGKSKRIPKSEW